MNLSYRFYLRTKPKSPEVRFGSVYSKHETASIQLTNRPSPAAAVVVVVVVVVVVEVAMAAQTIQSGHVSFHLASLGRRALIPESRRPEPQRRVR